MSETESKSNHSSDNEKPTKPKKAKNSWAETPLASALKHVNKNITVLRSHLRLSSDEEWKEWLQSPNFLPYWEELWTSWLSKQSKKYRGPGIEQVLSVMRTEAEDFDDKFVDKTDWDPVLKIFFSDTDINPGRKCYSTTRKQR